MSLLDKLRELGISENLIKEIEKFRSQYPVDKEYESRIPVPTQFYYGSDVWEQAITAVLCGENLLLVGEKATGKNLFAENLAGVFNRPRWDVSFHVNMDAASLIGTDTFSAGEVTFRPGPVYTAAKTGGFAVLDEINMVSFAADELRLYLDTHPCSDEALKMMKEYLERRKTLMASYAERYGTLDGYGMPGDEWIWNDPPMPWENTEGGCR